MSKFAPTFIDHPFYDSLNGRMIKPIAKGAGDGIYICVVEEIMEFGDLSYEGVKNFTEQELRGLYGE